MKTIIWLYGVIAILNILLAVFYISVDVISDGFWLATSVAVMMVSTIGWDKYTKSTLYLINYGSFRYRFVSHALEGVIILSAISCIYFLVQTFPTVFKLIF